MRPLRWIWNWFFVFPLVGLSAAFVIWIVAFGGLNSFGIPDLFWRIDGVKTFLAGFFLCVVFAVICFVGFLLETQSGPCSAKAYLATTYPLLIAWLIVGEFKAGGDAFHWTMIAGAIVGTLVVFVAGWLATRTAARLLAARPVRKTLRKVAGQRRVHAPAFHLVAAQIFLGLLGLYVVAEIFYQHITAATAICVLIGMTVMVYGAGRYYFRRTRLLFLAISVGVIACSNLRPAKYRYADLDALYRNPIRIPVTSEGRSANLINDRHALLAWSNRFTSTGKKPKLVIVSTSGGGIRAATWTVSVLSALNARLPQFLQHVRIVTGASGGMVGAANLVANLDEHGGFSAGAVNAIANDSLDPVARSLALHDVPKLFVPFAWADRGTALQRAWTDHAAAMRLPFHDLAAGEAAGWRPSLILTPMLVEDGRRLFISNLDLDSLSSVGGSRIGGAPNDIGPVYSRPAIELLRLIPQAASMQIASLARMNASFPWMSPAAELPTEPRRHVVDAGYFDNFGVSVAVAWIERNLDQITALTSGVVLVQIRDRELEGGMGNYTRPRASPWLNEFSEFLAPPWAFLQTRESIMLFHNDYNLQEISKLLAAKGGRDDFFTTVVFENPEAAALSWSLTESQRKRLLGFFSANATKTPVQRLNNLVAWWTR